MLLLDRMSEVYDQANRIPDNRSICEKLMERLQVRPRISSSDLARIPKQGAVIAVANHPFGMIEGPILGSVLPRIRPDVKIMTNSLLWEFPELRPICIFVNPFGGGESLKENQRGLKEALLWLKNGGMLVIFPAGEVAHLDLKQRQITDPPWSDTVARIARRTNAPVLPIYFRGSNSALFHIAGLIHPRLRTAMLPHEFLNKERAEIELRIGNAIPEKKLMRLAGDQALIQYLRYRTYALGKRHVAGISKAPAFLRTRSHETAFEPVIPEVGQAVLANEIAGLTPDHFVAAAGDLSAILARPGQIPNCLREIGRLRELTFRQTGEGTGKSIDLDEFDPYYLHLFVWNREVKEIVGAYRIGPSDEILPSRGKKGLYTNTLFAYKRAFLDRIRPALELGRSFVRPEYQKSYAPLLLLWKSIGEFVVKNPQYKILFGPVSISNSYNPASRQLMVTFLEAHNRSNELEGLVRARSPFRISPFRADETSGQQRHGSAECDIEELSALIGDIETDHKGVPILLKQYLKLGGKLVAFNLDTQFADAVDGLIVVDLTKTDSRVLERYMGKHGARSFLAYHQAAHQTRVPA